MKRLLQFAVSIALLTWIALSIDLAEVGSHLVAVDLRLLSLTLPILVADRWLMSSKWRLLLAAVGVPLSEWASFRMYAISNFVGLFLPATVGGDLSRAALAYKEGLPMAKVASSILVERLIGFAALIFMSLVGLVLLSTTFTQVDVGVRGLLLLTAGLLAGLILATIVSFHGRVETRLLRFLDAMARRPGLLSTAGESLGKLYRAYLVYSQHRLALLLFFVLSCLEGLLIISLAYVIALALGVAVPFTYVLASFTIVTLLIRLPISVDGFGIYEKGIQFFLLQIGVAESLGLSVGVLFHLFCLAAILPGGILLALYRGQGPQTT